MNKVTLEMLMHYGKTVCVYYLDNDIPSTIKGTISDINYTYDFIMIKEFNIQILIPACMIKEIRVYKEGDIVAK